MCSPYQQDKGWPASRREEYIAIQQRTFSREQSQQVVEEIFLTRTSVRRLRLPTGIVSKENCLAADLLLHCCFILNGEKGKSVFLWRYDHIVALSTPLHWTAFGKKADAGKCKGVNKADKNPAPTRNPASFITAFSAPLHWTDFGKGGRRGQMQRC